MRDDLRLAVRRLRHTPGFTLVGILTLAVAVGANTAILSIADAVLFRPLPYADPDRLSVIQMSSTRTGSQYTRVDFDDLRLIDERHSSLGRTAMAGSGPRVELQTPEGMLLVPTTTVTANYFEVLGVRAHRGRLFGPADATDGGRAAVLSFESWRDRFGADDAVIGQAVTIGATTFDVVGVLPPAFVFPTNPFFVGKPEVITVRPILGAAETGGVFHPIVRLEPGVTREQAQAEMDAIAAELARSNPERAESGVPYLNDVRTLMYPAGRDAMHFLLAAALLLLLLGCANLANMLLVRGRQRERETAISAALGASRLRIVRPVLFEAALIGVAGAAVAVAFTWIAFDALVRQVPSFVYGNAPIGVNVRVVLIGLALAAAGAVVFAVVPALRALKLDAQAVIQNRHRTGRSRYHSGRPLIVAQVAMAIVLVFGAVVTGRALVSALNVPLGFDPENVLAVGFFPGQDVEDRQSFFLSVMDQLGERPDVVSLGASGTLPFDGSAYDEGVRPDGATTSVAGIVHTLPGFFQTAGIQLRQGRLLTREDVRSSPESTVLSESAASVLFPDGDPLGRTFENGRGRVMRVVGVVADIRRSLPTPDGRPDQPAVYVLPGADAGRMTLVLRMRARSEAALTDVRRTVADMTPGAVIIARWWTDRIGAARAIRNPRFQTLILTGFAVAALGLTGLGIFGVVAFLVASRSREMGVRLALGSTTGALVSLVIRQALVPVAVGLLAGVLATRWLAAFAEAQLYDVDTSDLATLALAAATVVVAALTAAWIPARRASRVDPLVVLKAE